jgi:hypothetical protein
MPALTPVTSLSLAMSGLQTSNWGWLVIGWQGAA